MPIPVYGIFEGGGAKGLAHVAGLAAAERNDLEFIGVAGASAGALIAALVAVGYEANELFDPNNPMANILTRHQITPLSLIGDKEWKRFQKGQRQASRGTVAAMCGGVVASWLFANGAYQVGREVYRDGGYFTTSGIREQLNFFLRVKLMQHHGNAGRAVVVPERITFKDMDPISVPECCSLKIIVTDITNQRLVIFDGSPPYRDVEVAEAVAASVAIPFVFKPARITSYAAASDSRYADGGLVSNLPIWVFAEEKLNFERNQLPKSRVPILAFSLIEDCTKPPAATKPSPLAYVSAVGRAAVFGGQTVANRFVSDLLPIAMPVRLQTTQFDFSIKSALIAYYEAYAVAARILGRETRIKPAQIRTTLHEFRDWALGEIANRHPQQPIQHLRISLIETFGESSFRVVQSFNMADDADDRLVFSNLTQGAPDAFQSRAPAFLDFTPVWAAGTVNHMTKYEFALLRRTLRSAICLPVFAEPNSWNQAAADRPLPLGVVSIDSDTDLTHIFGDTGLLQSLAIKSLVFSTALQP